MKLPLAFEHVGKGPGERYVVHGQGYAVVLNHAKATVTVQSRRRQGVAADLNAATISMELAGARQVLATPGRELPGKVNYIRGNDPRQWQLGLPTYERVTYSEVYPGVDVVYYGNQKQLEFDLVLKPGANPEQVRLKFAGAQQISLGPASELVLASAIGNLSVAVPAVYQVAGGARKQVRAGYRLLANNEVAFTVGAYDHSKTLVIDPTIVYSTLLGGGTSDNNPQSIAIDGSGNAYVAGYTDATDFPTLNELQAALHSAPDGFVSKMNSSGTALLYSTYIGGSSSDQFFGIAVDSTGAAWVTGQTSSTDFPVLGAYQGALGSGASANAVVVKLNPNGSLAYSTYLGNTAFFTTGTAVAVDTTLNAYVTGYTSDSNFQITAGVVQTTDANNQRKAFVTKFSSSGAVVYSTFLGGDQVDYGYGIAADSSGNAYVTGQSFDTGFTNAPQGGAHPTNTIGHADAYVAKLNPTATALLYFTFLGGSGTNQGNVIAVDGNNGNAYIGGLTYSADLSPTAGTVQPSYGGGGDGFVAKLNNTGTAFSFITYLGGSRHDFVQSLAVDLTSASPGVYVTGGTDSSNFQTAAPFQAGISGNGTSLFLTSNGGTSWAPFDINIPGTVNDIAPNPTDPTAVVAATENGIYRTANGGTSWNLQSSTVLTSLARSPVSGSTNIIYGGVRGSIYQSPDDGVTWNFQGLTGTQIQQVVADPLTATTVYVFNTTSGVYKSANSGATGSWGTANTGLPSNNVRAMAAASDGSLYVSVAGQGIYKSTNQAGLWSAVNNGLPAGFTGSALAAAPNNASDLYVSNGTVYKTINGGGLWTQTGGNIPDANAGFLAVSPGDPLTVYVASPDAPTVYATSNAGTAWNAVGNGLGVATPTKIVIDPANTNSVFAITPVQVAGFVAKINPSGTSFVYSSYLSGTGPTTPGGIAADGAGDAFVTGNTTGGVFPTTASAFQTSGANVPEGFMVKISDSTAACSYSVSPASQLIYGNLQTVTYNVIAPSGCAWTASSNGFATVEAGASGSGSGTVSMEASQNSTGSTRSVTLTIAGQSVTLMQASSICTYTLSNYTPSVAAVGGLVQVNVTAGAGCNWVAVNNYPNAITAISGSPGTGNGTVTFTIAANHSRTSRTFNVPIGTTSANITQAFVVQGDFDGNGVPDLLWQNDTTRQVTVWYMGGAGGAVFQGWNYLSAAGVPGWHVVAVADFNGDGVPDLVWQNDTTRQATVWYMGGAGGAVFQGWNYLSVAGVPGWSIVAAADFNGDGVPDLVWQNDTTRQVTVWYMGGAGGAVFQGWNYLSVAGVPGWHVAAAADFNGDGVPDLVWQNDSTRQATVWYMGGAGGAVFQGWNYVSGAVPGWHVVAAVDQNGDGVPDLVWLNDSTRQVTVWYMGGAGGAVFQGWNYLSAAGVPGWSALN